MFLLDANVFIQAKNLHYGFDFCPAFWSWVDRSHAAGRVLSLEQVGDELAAGTDELATWAQARPLLFVRPDAATVPSLRTVSAWAVRAGYDAAALNTFLQVADFYLVAYAHAHGLSLVTHEVAADTIKKIKIPNAAVALGIKCVTPYAMLRSERARFVLGAGG